MRKINKILTALLMCSISLIVTAQETDIKSAEAAYSAEQYDKAIEIYESLLKNYGDSYVVFYNLGNSYYKSGKIASAILNYERALRIKPGDSDIRFNLEMAKMQTVDKIEPIQEFFLTKWFRAVRNTFSADTWAAIGIVCFILFIGSLILFFFSKWMRLKKLGFYLGVLMMIFVIFANIFGSNQKKNLELKGAIVFTPTVTVKSTPDNSGTDLFILHEGTKVFVKSTLGEWNEIELEDGNVGWINNKDITII